MPESADFVLYWWRKAAALVRVGTARRFGLIATNSLRQTLNRRVVEAHLKAAPVSLSGDNAAITGDNAKQGKKGVKTAFPSISPQPTPALSLPFAIPIHPWVVAAVRIAVALTPLR